MSIEKISKELKKSIAKGGKDEVRFLVTTYYSLQKMRKALQEQIRSCVQGKSMQPASLVYFFDQCEKLENEAKKALNVYAKNHEIGRWAMSICGIGPVIAAGLIAVIDMNIAKTPGHIYSFAGINPGQTWFGKKKMETIMRDNGVSPTSGKKIDFETAMRLAHTVRELGGIKEKTAIRKAKNEKGNITGKTLYQGLSLRPWNPFLKNLCWKIGESFSKTRNREEDFYGHLLAQRQIEEKMKNEQGKYQEQAEDILNDKPSHAQKKTYKEGKLPDGHIFSRAKRWAVKIFLSHWWEVAYEEHYGTEPPFQPYPIEHLGHAHKIEKPVNVK